jgi:hypothetical protein
MSGITRLPGWPSTAVAGLIALGLGAAQAQQARGVKPAEIDSRFDVIAKRIGMEPDGDSTSLTLKYDYRLNQNLGLNFELPADYTHAARRSRRYTRPQASTVSVTASG